MEEEGEMEFREQTPKLSGMNSADEKVDCRRQPILLAGQVLYCEPHWSASEMCLLEEHYFHFITVAAHIRRGIRVQSTFCWSVSSCGMLYYILL
uniref:Uncharacterized protein n=1 Tax=Anguilla anguilla TaxID=7936 RepID=A0A0E9X7K7_ANGAN